MNYFSKNLKFLREKKGIDQLKLSIELNVPQSTLSCWETGARTPKIEQIIDIANYFDVGIDIISKDYSIEQDSFAKKLKDALNLSYMTLKELADKTGIDESNISYYLLGKLKPNNINIKKISEVLNVNEQWFLGYDELDLLYNKYKNILTDSDKAIIKTIIEQRIKEKGGE